jgi:hypothetical protein
MVELIELERRILAVLQEAGEESIAALMNTVLQPAESPAEIEEIGQAISSLVRAGSVGLALERDQNRRWSLVSVAEALALASRLAAVVQFRPNAPHWTWATKAKLQIVTTEQGASRADEILKEFGYQWWLTSSRNKDRSTPT